MKTTKVLLLTALSMCWGFQAAEAQTGTVEGVFLVDGSPPLRAPGHREHQDRSIVISQIGRS